MPILPQPRRARPAAATVAQSGLTGLGLRRAVLRQAPALLVVLGLVWLLRDRLAALDTAEIGAALGRVGAAQWALGALFTTVSFWAVGQYDAVVHGLVGSGVAPRAAPVSGAAAIALAQTLGLGALTGALVRWRLLPELGPIGAMRVSVFVALSFLAGWAVLAALATLVVAPPVPGAGSIALGVLAVAAALMALSLARPRWADRLALPPLRAMLAILALAALDTLAAATVLWVLLPGGIALTPPEVLAAYLLALGAGLVLSTPGGVGPFELALVTLLPGVPQEPLLAAVIAYRALYYAVPAVLAALVVLRGPLPAPTAPVPALSSLPTAPRLSLLVEAVIEAAPRAEAGLLRHGRLALVTDTAQRPLAMASETGQSLIVLGDPLLRDADADALLDRAEAIARARFRAPVFYKSGARLARAARRRGWSVATVAEEAWLDPRSFTAGTPAHRQLRRKLRQAEAAGVTVETFAPDAPRPLPLAEMAAIAEDWARAHGGERGFSMGTWDPALLAWPRIYLARGEGSRLLGFITVHANTREHTLDLMRASPDAPDGTMHALVTAAIAEAGALGRARFSLAAVPLGPRPADPALLAFARARFAEASGAAGLRQFKASFAPRWEPLYAAAPSRRALTLGAIDLLREIARPPSPRP